MPSPDHELPATEPGLPVTNGEADAPTEVFAPTENLANRLLPPAEELATTEVMPCIAPEASVEDALQPQPSSSETWIPALGAGLSTPIGDRPPTPLPNLPGFEILSVLGQGGMGSVFKARQISLDRIVAVKTISTWAVFRPDARRRFDTEAHAIAQIRHPNVVQIYDVGWHGEQPYLVLEYLAGGSMDRLLAGRPQPARPAAEALLAIARGIEAAHDRGIIHRDLKPGNILIDRDPGGSAGLAQIAQNQLKITDFGLAKELDSGNGPTLDHEALGTPDYMAPEQAEARQDRIGPQTDIYALGVILYQMLTGRVPFRGAGAMETLAQVVKAEPVPPRRLVPQIPLDLETICLKCLRKESSQRYASASDLAADLEAFLQGRPIQARPMGLSERVWNWCRRHPAAASLGSALVLVLATGCVVSTTLYLRAERHLRDAQQKFLLAQAAVNFVQGTVGDKLNDSADIPTVREEVLRGVLDFHRQFLSERSDDPVLRHQAGTAWLRVGDIEVLLGDLNDAKIAFDQGLKMLEELVATHPDEHQFRFDLANGWKRYGILFAHLQRYGEAEHAYRRGRDLCLKLYDRKPDDRPTWRLLGDCWNNLGNRLAARQAYTEAEEAFQQAVRLRERLVAAEPGNVEYKLLLASVQHNLASLELRSGRFAQAQERLQRHIDEHERFLPERSAAPAFRRQLAGAYRELGYARLFQKQHRAALDAWRRGRELREKLAADFPTVPGYQREHVVAVLELADLL
ncbi:MAG TPA: serine/threonine-protein kinase, partial [Gemmatales bacterium]|nr:serine/threonine-protein kinase [Gemmatales bacterium]